MSVSLAINPLEHFNSFWKPLIGSAELSCLAAYARPDERPGRGIVAWVAEGKPNMWRVVDGDETFSLFATVHPVANVPPSAEVVAEILDPTGAHHSYVLYYPADNSLVVPFDPNAAIEAFWHEDHVPRRRRTALPKPLLHFYYSMAKPVMPAALKRALRQSMARRALSAPGALAWPVDESLDSLQRLLLRVVLIASGRHALQFAWFWPDAHPWAAILTHDVETADGLTNISIVTGMETERGLRSSFNFVPCDYEVPSELLGELSGGGFEVGVHGYTHDGLLFSNWPTFEQRARTINDYAKAWRASGFRSPATYRNLDWLHVLEFEYDSSVSNSAPCEPQPGGCGSFFPYAVDGLMELPITLPQDHTLYELLGHTDAGEWLKCIRRIESAHGMACVLTHPDPGTGYIGWDGNIAHYSALLDALAVSRPWTPLPRELAHWWRVRAETALDGLAGVPGMTFGTAILGASGRLEIDAPVR